MFHADYPLAALRPAPYNPRTIDEQAFLALQHSITTLGMVKPIIAGEPAHLSADPGLGRAQRRELVNVRRRWLRHQPGR